MLIPEQPVDTALDEISRNSANDFWTEIHYEIEGYNFPSADRFREVFREAIDKAIARKCIAELEDSLIA